MKRTLTTKLTLTTAAAALALGATACDVEDPNGADDGVDDPVLEDEEL